MGRGWECQDLSSVLTAIVGSTDPVSYLILDALESILHFLRAFAAFVLLLSLPSRFYAVAGQVLASTLALGFC